MDKTNEFLDVSKIKPDKNQPRVKSGFEEEAIKELANSIKEVGIILPLLVQRDGTLIDGERRWRAAKLNKMKKVPVIYNEDLSNIQRLEYQLIASLNSTSCAEEEIAPKIKEYIKKTGYSNVVAATRLGKTEGYIRTMINMLADLTEEEKEVIKLWRKTKQEKGIAPSNLAEIKQQHPDKLKELIELSKEQVVCRSDIRDFAKDKAIEVFKEKQKEDYDKAINEQDKELKIIRSKKIIDNLRSEIVLAERDLNRFISKVKIVRFKGISWENNKEQATFAKFIDNALGKARNWVEQLERIQEEVGV